MLEKPIASHAMGLEIDGPTLKGAALHPIKGKLQVESLFEIMLETPTGENGDVKPLYTTVSNPDLEQFRDNHLIVATIGKNEALIRPLDLKLKKEKDIDSTLAFQVEPLLPYPVENAIVDKIILNKDKDGTKLTIVSARKDHISKSLAEWNTLGIEPEVLTTPSQALVLFANKFTGSLAPLYILHIGITGSLCLLSDNGKLIAAQAFDGGIDGLMRAEGLPDNSEPGSVIEKLNEKDIRAAIVSEAGWKAAVDALRMDVTRTIYSLGKQARGREISEILVTGPGAVIKGLPELVCQTLGKTFVAIDPEIAPGTGKDKLLAYALPIGAALSAIQDSGGQINFRQNEFAYPDPWKRLKEPLALYLLLTIGLAAALYLFGAAYTAYRQGEVRQEYLNLLEVMNKPYTPFENEFAAKGSGGRSTLHEGPLAPEMMTNEEIERRLNYLEKEIQATPQIFPLQPNVPLVSDVLAWISTHPAFIGVKGDDGAPPQSLKIESFSYNMVKRPEPTKKQEKYQVKVELEFSSTTPKMAREFHDALIAPNDIVDPKSEIKWTSNRDRYKTSFYLKDKTQYPTP